MTFDHCVTTELNGRLGNNLFQIATGIYHAAETGQVFILAQPWKYNQLLKFPLPEYERFPEYPLVYQEKQFSYNPIPHHINYLKGYFQSESYFPNKKLIKNYFQFKFLSEYRRSNNFCCVHIRRGDYINLPNHHPTLPISYYHEAMLKFPRGTQFDVYTDDVAWFEDNLLSFKYYSPLIKFTIKSVSMGDEIADFSNMCQYQNHIIANSTFSWWAAYLSDATAVIAPKQWFGPAYSNNDTKDLIPKGWARV